MSNILNIDNLEHSETQSGAEQLPAGVVKYWQRQYLKKTIFGAEHLQASPLLALLIGRYSPHCRHKPLSPNILGNIFLDKLGQWQM